MPKRAPQWNWKSSPTTPAEFADMMLSLDRFLGENEVKPQHRPFRSLEVLAPRFGYDGPFAPAAAIRTTQPYDAGGIIKQAFEWYTVLYAARLNSSPGPGSVVMMVRGDLLRARVPHIFGEVVFEMNAVLEASPPAVVLGRGLQKRNIMAQVEGMTPAFAASLSGNEQHRIAEFFALGATALHRLQDFVGHGLFDVARDDYETSVDALMKGNWRNAHWCTSACLEKLFKGILDLAGLGFPTNGTEGHDLVMLGDKVSMHTGHVLNPTMLKSAHCAPGRRYSELPLTRMEAYSGHVSLLKILISI